MNGFEIKLEQAIAPKGVLEVRFYQPVYEGDTITIGQNNSLEYNGKPILVEDINLIIAKPLVLTPYSPEGSIYVQKVLENKNLPFKTLESFEQLGTDKSALLNASEVRFIDSLIRLSPQVPELNNKRIAFVGDKKGFFRDVKRRIASRKPLKQYAVLYVFSDSQKQRSAGFDAAIAFDELCFSSGVGSKIIGKEIYIGEKVETSVSGVGSKIISKEIKLCGYNCATSIGQFCK